MNGHERRAAVTKEAIKDAMLSMLERSPFTYITVASLSREAKVGRATFYTHYTGLTDVLDELADDAINATKSAAAEGLSGIATLADQMRKTTDPGELAPYMDLLPVCQRVADNPKYKVLFTDSFVSEYMLMNIYRRESKKMLPYIRKNTHVTEEEADKIFLFGVTGAFAVNRSMGWNKDQSWYRVQRVLLTFLEGGYEALRKL
ncbi:MAG: TetR/AcrR family transcriptional regulator [Lachnospiraceae bacterium]|nr:TetR/AcrR family transcriptional regulator [Lachnospiraceae bacterium]